jgi:hypothetical protein
MFFFVWFLIPETKGLSLERMDELFGNPDLLHRKHDEESQNGSIRRAGTAEKNAHVAEIEEREHVGGSGIGESKGNVGTAGDDIVVQGK